MAGKRACAPLGEKIETKASSGHFKLLLPAILKNYLLQFTEKVLTNDRFI